MRRTLLLILLTVSAVATPASADPPTNDDPAGAVRVDTFPATLTVDTSEATTGPFEEECSSFFLGVRLPARALWYRLIIPDDTGYLRVTQTGGASVVLWDRLSTLPTGHPVLDRRECLYPGDDYPAWVGSGEVYMSVASPVGFSGGPYELTLEAVAEYEPPAVPNDVPYRATRITALPYEVEQDTSGADWDQDRFGCQSGSYVWYTYTPPTDQRLTFSVTSVEGYESSVAVYSLGEQVETVGCAARWDDPAVVEAPVDAAVPLLIGIGDSGLIRLRVEETPAPRTPDDREHAALLTLGADVSYDTTGTTLAPGEDVSCGSGGSLWYALSPAMRDAGLTVTGGASVALFAGEQVLSCSQDGALNVPKRTAATHVQVRGDSARGVISLTFDRPYGKRVSDASPFEADCAPDPTAQLNTEVEVAQAVNPHDPDHLVMAWQQDRYRSAGGAQGIGASVSFDGGETWTNTVIPGVSLCSGGLFPRATDPWPAIDADGTAYVMSLGFDPGAAGTTAGSFAYLTNTVLINRSEDGGLTWSDPIVVAASPGIVFHDKETLTADPNVPGLLYAVWDAYPTNVLVPVFSRSEDGGRTWTPPVPLPVTGSGAGDQIVVLDDGTLVEIAPRGTMKSITSRDRGLTWSRERSFGSLAGREGPPGIRGGADIPSVATDGRSVFVSWSDTYHTYFARSDDAGATWRVEQVGGAEYPMRSTTAIAVLDDGTLGVMTYLVKPGFQTALVLGVSEDGGQTWSEAPVTHGFDFGRAPVSVGRGYFLGDYFGLSASGDHFIAAASIVPPGTDERVADIYSVKVAP